MIQKIAEISGLSESQIKDFFQVWKGFYNINDFTAKEYADIIIQHV